MARRQLLSLIIIVTIEFKNTLGYGFQASPQLYSNTGGVNGAPHNQNYHNEVQRPGVVSLLNGNIQHKGHSYPAPSGLTHNNGPEIYKHVYISVAPDMPAPPPIKIYANQKSQRHYKIVFIKTPSMKPPEILLPNVNPINEEKTLIYVLNENPKPIASQTLQVGPGASPQNPEVFLIKYDSPNSISERPPQTGGGGYGSSNSHSYGSSNSHSYGNSNSHSYGNSNSNSYGNIPAAQERFPTVVGNNPHEKRPTLSLQPSVPVKSPLLHLKEAIRY